MYVVNLRVSSIPGRAGCLRLHSHAGWTSARRPGRTRRSTRALMAAPSLSCFIRGSSGQFAADGHQVNLLYPINLYASGGTLFRGEPRRERDGHQVNLLYPINLRINLLGKGAFKEAPYCEESHCWPWAIQCLTIHNALTAIFFSMQACLNPEFRRVNCGLRLLRLRQGIAGVRHR